MRENKGALQKALAEANKAAIAAADAAAKAAAASSAFPEEAKRKSQPSMPGKLSSG